MKCEHGCGTEIDGCSGYELPGNSAHTPERCQRTTRALLDEARRELAQWHSHPAVPVKILVAAEKRAVEAERERDELKSIYEPPQQKGSLVMALVEKLKDTEARAERFRATIQYALDSDWISGKTRERMVAALAADSAPEAGKTEKEGP